VPTPHLWTFFTAASSCADDIPNHFSTIITFPNKLFLALLLTVSTAGADPVSVSRDEAIRMAFENNRELAVASLEVKRAASRQRWSGRLDNPKLEVALNGDGIGLDEGESNFEVALSQNFPLTARLKREKDVRQHQVILAEAEIAERRRELAGEVDLTIVEMLATREEIRLQNKLVNLNREILEFLRVQVKRGEVSSLEVTQSMLSGRTLEQGAKALVARETQQLLALNKIIGLDAETELQVNQGFTLPGERPSTSAELGAILTRRPDYVLALAKVGEAEAVIALEQSKKWEDVSLKLFVEGENAVDEPIGLERNTFAGVGFSIPLPLRKRNQDGIAQAEIDREEANRIIEAARFRIESEAEEAYRQRLDAWELARDASGEILGLAEKNLEDFNKAYQQGQTGLLQVQRAQEQILEVRTAATLFSGDYHRAAARVRLVTGAYPGLSVRENK